MAWFLIIGLVVALVATTAGYYISQGNKKEISQALFTANGCTITKEMGDLLADEVNKRWAQRGGAILFHYSDIIGFDVSEVGGAFKKNGKKISENLSSLSVNIYTSVPGKPCVMIDLIMPGTSKDSASYRLGRLDADLLIGWFTQITAASGETADTVISSAADEIAKYKKLLDDGAITEEEYNAKKAQLLNL